MLRARPEELQGAVPHPVRSGRTGERMRVLLRSEEERRQPGDPDAVIADGSPGARICRIPSNLKIFPVPVAGSGGRLPQVPPDAAALAIAVELTGRLTVAAGSSKRRAQCCRGIHTALPGGTECAVGSQICICRTVEVRKIKKTFCYSSVNQMINNIRHLRFVVAVARAKSLQEASRDLLISESALSAAIKSVEAEVGYSIFVRRPARALVLTQAGIDFVAEASAFLDEVEAFHNRVVGRGNELAGTVKLAAASSFAAVLLPPVLQAIRASHPHIDVQVADYDIPDLLQRLREGDVDVAITYDYLYEADVEMRQLVEVIPYIGVSPKAGFTQGGVISLKDFVKKPLILIDQQVTKQRVLQLFTRLGLEPTIGMYPKSVRLLSALVVDDFGYGIYFLRPFRKMESETSLHRLHIAEDVDRHNLVLAIPRRRALTAGTRVVADICEKTLRTMGSSIVFRR